MKTRLLLFLLVSISLNLSAQTSEIRGIIMDTNNEPLDFVNVYVGGTLEGTVSAADGSFYLKITARDSITLIVSSIGYKTYKKTEHINYFKNIKIVLHPDETILEDVVIMAGNYNILSASTLEGRDAVALVTTAGSEGDLYKSISLLPGTQASGPDGRLIVRGGSTRETQTYLMICMS